MGSICCGASNAVRLLVGLEALQPTFQPACPLNRAVCVFSPFSQHSGGRFPEALQCCNFRIRLHGQKHLREPPTLSVVALCLCKTFSLEINVIHQSIDTARSCA